MNRNDISARFTSLQRDLALDALDLFDAYNRSLDDMPSIFDDDYILDIAYRNDAINDHLCALTLNLTLNDDLHNLDLIALYTPDRIIALTIYADDRYLTIPYDD